MSVGVWRLIKSTLLGSILDTNSNPCGLFLNSFSSNTNSILSYAPLAPYWPTRKAHSS